MKNKDVIKDIGLFSKRRIRSLRKCLLSLKKSSRNELVVKNKSVIFCSVFKNISSESTNWVKLGQHGCLKLGCLKGYIYSRELNKILTIAGSHWSWIMKWKIKKKTFSNLNNFSSGKRFLIKTKKIFSKFKLSNHNFNL